MPAALVSATAYGMTPTAPPPPELIIFDCDGVLVDSEPLSMRALIETLAAHGTPISLEQGYTHFLGRSMAHLKATLRDVFHTELSPERLEEMRQRLYALFRSELKAMAGVAEVLPHLPFRSCVASSSEPNRIRLSLEIAGLLPFFDGNIYSASMVRHGKPAPDLFLLAAERMGVAPERCVVIEDSPAGIEAAHRAGMRVLGFVGGAHAGVAGLERLIAALAPSVIFDDMRALPSLLDTLTRSPGHGRA